jgi:hypothetical protein
MSNIKYQRFIKSKTEYEVKNEEDKNTAAVYE